VMTSSLPFLGRLAVGISSERMAGSLSSLAIGGSHMAVNFHSAHMERETQVENPICVFAGAHTLS
jgi:hypothetical protein